jgi:hypothetical protein
MPRNGSGLYGPPAGTAAVPSVPIESVFVDAAALTNSVNVNGTKRQCQSGTDAAQH